MKRIWSFLRDEDNRNALAVAVAVLTMLGGGFAFLWTNVIRTADAPPKAIAKEIQSTEPPPQSTNMTASADNGASAVVAKDNAQVTIGK